MKLISDIMSKNVHVLTPDDSLFTAAQMMNKMNIGAIPVCENNRLVGMITDRDITIRGVAVGKASDTPIKNIMSPDVTWCFEHDQIEEVSAQMSNLQVRRIPVINDQKQLVGIISLGDLASRYSSKKAADPLKDISITTDPMLASGASFTDMATCQAVS